MKSSIKMLRVTAKMRAIECKISNQKKKICSIQQKAREKKAAAAAAVMNKHGKWNAQKRQQKRIIVNIVENYKGIVVK